MLVIKTDSLANRPIRSLNTSRRLDSIDLLRGVIIIIMALDHVRDYFHADAFLYSPTDLSQTNMILFLTRWITHYCAPAFVLLAGMAAYLYGIKRSKKELSFFLFTRGIWLILVELFIVGLFRTFNPHFTYFNLQVIWAIGLSMMVLSAIIYLRRSIILFIGVLLISVHNLFDSIHITGKNLPAVLWSLLHEPGHFTYNGIAIRVGYPVLPWIGIMIVGYYLGRLYVPVYNPAKRKKILLFLGWGSIALFIILRICNGYGDAAHWAPQKSLSFTIMSFLNLTKYPPSLLYVLMTLGPVFIFLSLAENPLYRLSKSKKITVFGRVPMFFYLAHILLIHLFALPAAIISGFKLSDMILSRPVNDSPQLKGYGFSLITVYVIWIGIILILYPLCKRFDKYKRTNQSSKRWLSYL